MKLPIEIDLKGKVAVVTGGGGVLCSEFVRHLPNAALKLRLSAEDRKVWTK